MVAAAVGFGVGISGTLEPVGNEKAGRILIDDRFCGVWEPAARQLDTEWYGDFPTYSFTSLAEWLGHWFQVDVNTSLPYDDDLLSRYDVLIIKTTVEPIQEAERAAIDRFVRGGGGLLLVGDHTNLLGMGTHLNSLCAPYGIRFRYDSISPSYGGGFSRYVAPPFVRHTGAIHVDSLEFMTSCSLAVASDAEAILTAGNCRREPHDYAAAGETKGDKYNIQMSLIYWTYPLLVFPFGFPHVSRAGPDIHEHTHEPAIPDRSSSSSDDRRIAHRLWRDIGGHSRDRVTQPPCKLPQACSFSIPLWADRTRVHYHGARRAQ